MQYRFADFALDSERFELSRDGLPLALQPRALHLLERLVAAQGRMLTKDQIFDDVWDGRIVSESALTSQIKALRKTLGDTAKPYRIIGTVHGQGFRLLADVSLGDSAVMAAARDTIDEIAPMPAIGTQPSIAVLPFQWLGVAHPGSALADALPDEIITALSRLHILRVIARGSTFRFRSTETAPEAIREAFGVDYCVSGTIEPIGERIAISVELADTRDRSIVWSERFETKPGGIHEIRQEIVTAITSQIEHRITWREAQRARLKVPSQLTAWETYHLGMSQVFVQSVENSHAAVQWFERSIEIDPEFSRAHAGLSHICWWLSVQNLLRGVDDVRARMIDAARRALDADPFDPAAHLAMGRATAFEPDQEESILWLEQAVDHCPSYAWGHIQLAAKRSLVGPVDKAIVHAETALALSPRDPLRHSAYAALATAHARSGRLEEGAKWGRKLMQVPHTDIVAMITALCVNHSAGHAGEARRIAERIRIVHPEMTIDAYRRAHPMMPDAIKASTGAILADYDID